MAKKEETPEVSEEETKQETEAAETEAEQTVEVTEDDGQTEETAFDMKFKQFQAQNAEEYARKLEEAYLNSSQEGQRLNKELSDREKELEVIQKIVQSNPDLKQGFADSLGGDYNSPAEDLTAQQIRQIIREELGKNPALSHAEEQRKSQDKAIYDEFVQEHPEVETNPQLAEELETYFGALAQAEANKGKTVDFKSTLFKAWKVVSGEQELAGMKKVIQKESAAMGSAPSEGKAKAGQSLSEAERKIAQAFGLSDEDYHAGKKLSQEDK
jgi:hypothetical protein